MRIIAGRDKYLEENSTEKWDTMVKTRPGMWRMARGVISRHGKSAWLHRVRVEL